MVTIKDLNINLLVVLHTMKDIWLQNIKEIITIYFLRHSNFYAFDYWHLRPQCYGLTDEHRLADLKEQQRFCENSYFLLTAN